MWGALNKLAEQAKSVAAELEGQLDASVGVDSSQQQSAASSSFNNFLGGGATAMMVEDTSEGLDQNAWNDDDFQVDDDIDDTAFTRSKVPPSTPITQPPPEVAVEESAKTIPTPTPEVADGGSGAGAVDGGAGDDDSAGWNDDNLQFDEVNLQQGSRDNEEESDAVAEAPAAESESASIVSATTATDVQTFQTSPCASPKAAHSAVAATAVAAVADALPAVSGFFSSKVKAKLEASLPFLETQAVVEAEEEEQQEEKPGTSDSNIFEDTATLEPQPAPSVGIDTAEEEKENKDVEDGWAGNGDNDLDISEVDDYTAPESPVTDIAATSAADVTTPISDTAPGPPPDSTNAEISPPPVQVAAELPMEAEESIATAAAGMVVDATSALPTEPNIPSDVATTTTVPPPPPEVPVVTIMPSSSSPPSPGAPPPNDNDSSAGDGGTVDSNTAAAVVMMTQDQVASQQDVTRIMENRFDELQRQLQQREQQLMSKTEQMSQMQQMFDVERQEMLNRLEGTKEEAKRRIQMAKDRVQTMEAKLQAATAQARNHSSSASEDAAKQQEMIDALRQEGEKLAVKQLTMEKAVRAAKSEARELLEELELEQQAKSTALEKIEQLEADLKATKEKLTSAHQNVSQADKLETTLQQAREDGERKASTILSLEQQVKELKAEAKELLVELESSRKGMAIETEREQKKLRKEHNSVIDDLETKLRTTEKEAAVREDALRHEVSELRKRWQDAVRRADSLSMDVQSSTAPLLRQLESMERQSRARAAGWAELETKLRAELEETVISNEKLSKDRMDFKTKMQRLERTCKERDEDLRSTKTTLEDATVKIEKLEAQVNDMETKGAKQKEEWAEVERLANEGVSRVRSEMTQTVVDAENRHRSQLDALEAELRQERDKKQQLERQVQDLLDNNAVMMGVSLSEGNLAPQVSLATKEKKLRNSEGQAQILAGALNGLGKENMDDDDDDSEDEYDEHDNGELPDMNGGGSGSGSFAALAELSSKLKVAKGELQTLRKSLSDSERTRENLLVELGESRYAKEKLPLFETRVEELTRENREMKLEIQGLQDDIAEVRELYRTQLNVLLEEKAAAASSHGEENDESANTSADMSPFETEAAPPEQAV